jgi:valyl-tRNA synthetase
VQSLPDSNAPFAVVGEARIMLHKEVDPAVEAERISKEIARVASDIAKANAKLANPSFVERAPPHVVDQERKRLAEFEDNLRKLQEQLQKLRGRK